MYLLVLSSAVACAAAGALAAARSVQLWAFTADGAPSNRPGWALAQETKSFAAPLQHILLISAAQMALYYTLLFRQSATAFREFRRLRGAWKDRREKANKDGKALEEAPPALMDVKYGALQTGSKTVDAPARAAVLAADRAVVNLVEQSLPFALFLWLHALSVSVQSAAVLGWVWVAFRAIYPVAWALKVVVPGVPMIFLSTIPAYTCVFALAAGVFVWGV